MTLSRKSGEFSHGKRPTHGRTIFRNRAILKQFPICSSASPLDPRAPREEQINMFNELAVDLPRTTWSGRPVSVLVAPSSGWYPRIWSVGGGTSPSPTRVVARVSSHLLELSVLASSIRSLTSVGFTALASVQVRDLIFWNDVLNVQHVKWNGSKLRNLKNWMCGVDGVDAVRSVASFIKRAIKSQNNVNR